MNAKTCENVINALQGRKEIFWRNPELAAAADALGRTGLSLRDVDDAEARLKRFAPFIAQVFPETGADAGIIESPLSEIPEMEKSLRERDPSVLPRKLYLKRDSELAVAGSVKARGGIYEVLKHAEDLAVNAGLLSPEDDYRKLASPEFREFFSRYRIHVGSTGNLGLSIGITAAALGFGVYVHMSADARQWKKDLLREKGAHVAEYASDYSRAVEEGRKLALQDPAAYFVDDENSKTLFLGYAVAARRLKKQLEEKRIAVDAGHPLFVTVPCGVGGAPGGVCFGLKQEFGDAVHVFFAEPVESPCMLLGLASGKQDGICVQDIGLSGKTAADGLAVGRPSRFVGKTVRELVSGVFTVNDARLYEYMRLLFAAENLFAEPSACAAFAGYNDPGDLEAYIQSAGLSQVRENITHIAWVTGGNLVPAEERARYLSDM